MFALLSSHSIYLQQYKACHTEGIANQYTSNDHTSNQLQGPQNQLIKSASEKFLGWNFFFSYSAHPFEDHSSGRQKYQYVMYSLVWQFYNVILASQFHTGKNHLYEKFWVHNIMEAM